METELEKESLRLNDYITDEEKGKDIEACIISYREGYKNTVKIHGEKYNVILLLRSIIESLAESQ